MSRRRPLWGVQAAFVSGRTNHYPGRWALAKQQTGAFSGYHTPTSRSCSRSARRMLSTRSCSTTTSSTSFAFVSKNCPPLFQQRRSYDPWQPSSSRRRGFWSTTSLLSSTPNDDNDGRHHTTTGTSDSMKELNTLRNINTQKHNSEQEVTCFLNHVQESLCERILPYIIQSGQREITVNDTVPNSETIFDPDTQPPIVLLVAVSGGCDSMGLLHALLDMTDPVVDTAGRGICPTPDTIPFRRFLFQDSRTKHRYDLVVEVHVAHFDHRQRGRESEQDKQLVQETCRRYDLPCHVYHWGDSDDDDSDDEKDSVGSIKFSQDKARQWRQSTLAQLLKDLTKGRTDHVPVTTNQRDPSDNVVERPGVILTAHHANDSQETLLLKLLRGVHVQNLSGMDAIHYRETSQTFWARPLLEVTKDQIQDYLTQQGYVWREDESNRTDKYLRNRVRNELIPLMEDLVGGDAVLQKRLFNLEEQCRELRTDLSGRVQLILNKRVTKTGQFLLSDNENVNLSDLAVRQALYEWASQATNKRQLSYDLWKRVMDQLEHRHNNRQWVLPLGDEWNIQRVGDSLQVVNTATFTTGQENGEGYQELALPEREKVLEWSMVEEINGNRQSETSNFVVRLPSELNSIEAKKISDVLKFMKASPGDFQGIQWKITPPWRTGRSPVKLGSFLRGQKVPLHLRDSAPVIICKVRPAHEISEADPVLVAVQINGKWVVDAAWDSTGAVDQGASQNSYALLRLKE